MASFDKGALRKTILSVLAGKPQTQVAAESAALTHSISELPQFAEAKNIGLFMSMSAEADTMPLIEKCFQLGKNVFLPRIVPLASADLKRFPKQRSCLHFVQVETLTQVEQLQPRGIYKIREPELAPSLDAYSLLSLDMLVMPGVGFTKTGERLGYGGGFYDDFIKRYQEKGGNRPILVGIGLEEQLVEKIEVEDHDEKLDYVVIAGTVY